ncbi:hypothetical protein HUJ04_012529 [Dendroctonus ponderosae]|nr:hypothetical protein HUJ04_012529 [Dendroctonus ponderosae]
MINFLQDLKTGWVSSSSVTTSGNPPTLLAVPSIITQQPVNTSVAPNLQAAVTAVPVQLKTTPAIVAPIMTNPPKPDTSSKWIFFYLVNHPQHEL